MAGEPGGAQGLPTVSGGHGPRFIRHGGTVAPLVLDDADADRDGMAAPAEAERTGLVPDEDQEGGASILIARDSVAPGGDPLSAVAELLTLGVRALLAPGFSRELYVGLVASGVLPVTLDEEAIEEIADRVASNPGMELSIDLEKQLIDCVGEEAVPFETDPRVRNKLLLGLTDLDEAMRYIEDAAALRTQDRERRPWMYDGV